MSEAPKLSYAGQAGAQALLALIAYELQTCVIKILPAIACCCFSAEGTRTVRGYSPNQIARLDLTGKLRWSHWCLWSIRDIQKPRNTPKETEE